MFLKVVFKKRNGKVEKNNLRLVVHPISSRMFSPNNFYRNNCFNINIVHETTWLKQLQQMFHCFILVSGCCPAIAQIKTNAEDLSTRNSETFCFFSGSC